MHVPIVSIAVLILVVGGGSYWCSDWYNTRLVEAVLFSWYHVMNITGNELVFLHHPFVQPAQLFRGCSGNFQSSFAILCDFSLLLLLLLPIFCPQ